MRRVGLCVGQNQMCHLCGWLKLFLKNVRWEKIKIQKRWLLGRLSDGSFVPSLYVLFCRSFLLCRLLGLQVTCRVLAMGGFLALNFNRRTEVEFCTSVDTKPFSPPIANTMLYDVVMFWVLVQLNIFVCHFLIYPGICTLIFLTIQFLFLKLNQSLKIEQSNFPLYRSLKMFVLF